MTTQPIKPVGETPLPRADHHVTFEMVRDNHVKKVTAGDLVGWGVKGLYRRID